MTSIPTDLTTLKGDELRELVKATDAAQYLSGHVSKTKKADLIAALEAVHAPKVGRRSWTDRQATEAVRLRHDELLSWATIAKRLELGSPGVARRAYREATGTEGVLPRLANKPGRPTEGMVAGHEAPEILGEEAATDEQVA